MVDRLKLDEDLMGILVDQTRFRGMVGSLMYLTANADQWRMSYSKKKYLGKCSISGDRVLDWSYKEAKKHGYLNNRGGIHAYVLITHDLSTSTYDTISFEEQRDNGVLNSTVEETTSTGR
ncbi:hypothetical protein Tco_0878192 [Tanacetum coccineum]|uniref:Reverse transcriptase Ty1/copia-type domain-containing protein n=1 Tax=Tanacetum coccineum TaxID=301880 RepID=A0ABQ5BZY6_9ASTR